MSKLSLPSFPSPPFTVQRVCELIVEPTKFYKKRDFYLRAMEKVHTPSLEPRLSSSFLSLAVRKSKL